MFCKYSSIRDERGSLRTQGSTLGKEEVPRRPRQSLIRWAIRLGSTPRWTLSQNGLTSMAFRRGILFSRRLSRRATSQQKWIGLGKGVLWRTGHQNFDAGYVGGWPTSDGRGSFHERSNMELWDRHSLTLRYPSRSYRCRKRTLQLCARIYPAYQSQLRYSW